MRVASILFFLTRLLPSFIVAWLVTFTLASLFHSQYIVNQLVNVGVVVTLEDRLRLISADWQGLLPTYGSIIAIGLSLAFWLASWINQKVKQQNQFVFTLAGLGALAVILTILESIMNINLIAGARGWGFYAQLIAGAAGGFVFARIMKRVQRTPGPTNLRE